MLTPEERSRLNSFTTVTKKDLEKDVTRYPSHYVEVVHWLSEKLKELNDEVIKYKATIKVRDAVISENKIYISNLLEEVESLKQALIDVIQLRNDVRSSVEELTKPQKLIDRSDKLKG